LPAILINGQAAEQISVLDRGFQYGDGLFETLRVTKGEPRRWLRHMARLAEGCQRLRITMPEPALLWSEAISLCADTTDAVLKIILTRGVGERGYAPPAQADVTRVLSLSTLTRFPAAHYHKGVALRVCNMRLSHNPALAGIKHLNRLEQVLARAEWGNDSDVAEGLMLDSNTNNNNVIEGTMSNLFSVQASGNGPLLKTPKLTQCGVKGITRECIMEAAESVGMAVQEAELSLDELYQSEELFISNTLIGIWPVRRLEAQAFPVGPVTTQLSQALESMHE
jgi:4-amino-4-deoxychorismate lyase